MDLEDEAEEEIIDDDEGDNRSQHQWHGQEENDRGHVHGVSDYAI